MIQSAGMSSSLYLATIMKVFDSVFDPAVDPEELDETSIIEYKLDYLVQIGVKEFLSNQTYFDEDARNEDVVVYMTDAVTSGNGINLYL